MIKFSNCKITPKDINILNSAVKTALEYFNLKTDFPSIHWICQLLAVDDLNIPVITGITNDLFITVKGSCIDSDLCLESVVIDSETLSSPLTYQLSPLHEMYVLANASKHEPEKRVPHSQLSACSKLIQEMYANDPDYSIDMPVPKVFFSKLDLDYYMSNLSVTLEESILLWMESTGRLSVNMDDEGILVPTILKNNIKRVYMHGAARNQVRVELHNGDIHEFRNMSASVQVEICNEILSILPPF